MMKKTLTLIAALGLALAQAQEKRDFVLATATTGGTFYPVGTAIATLSKVKLADAGINLSAISSAGSEENLALMKKNEAQLSMLQGLWAYYAWNGEGGMKAAGKQENLRAISALWQNVEHFIVVAPHAKTGTIEDYVALKGKSMALGPRNSGTIGSNEILLKGLGIDIYKDYQLMYGGYGASTDALQDNKVEGASIPAGVPAGAVSKLFASIPGKVKLLNITDEQLAKMDGGLNIWTRYVIPKGTYTEVNEDTQTIGQAVILAVNADVSEEDVYQITKAIYENLPFLHSIHVATKDIKLESALNGLPIPLHSGAARYFKEQGLTIPEHLIAP
ncbi:MAG: TAXI family TRAP transporter solute-binding subunit [Cardiobacteriaceae bacterium]|nr:TAXI family TRAP transporter solute-binding subunit [Cardiobacteriaceae bacterium]